MILFELLAASRVSCKLFEKMNAAWCKSFHHASLFSLFAPQTNQNQEKVKNDVFCTMFNFSLSTDFRTWVLKPGDLQSGASSPAKHGGAYFSAVFGSIADPVAAPGHCKPQVP